VELATRERSGECRDGARIDTAAEKNADLHIAAELVADGFAEEVAGSFSGLIKSSRSDRIVLNRQIPEIFSSATCG